MIAIGQYTIAVVSDGVTGPQGPQGVSVTKMVREYCKSSSSTSLPANPNWTETEPTIGANEYLWARDRTDKSDGTSSYGPAICSTNISDVKHNVDKANKSITDKVWESDITTKINQYDGSTVSTIRDRVSTTETDISGIKTRVSDVESETDDLGTRMTTAETAIDQTANNVVIKATESDTTAAQGGQHLIQSLINVAPSGVTISADKVNIEGAAIFSSGRLSQTNLNNAYAGKGDALSTTEPLYYRSTSSTTPTITTSTSIGTSNNTDNAWTYVMPIPKRNSYFFTCERQVHADGTVTFSTVRALDSQTYTSKWVSSSDQTYIDGGSIYTHSITTSQLATDAIKSTNYLAGGTNSPYSSAGTFLDLSNGNFYTPNFGVQSLTGKAYLNGEIIATSGSIGDDSGNYWEIGNTTDSQGNGSASIVGNGTAYIQDGDWQIHSGLSNYSNGSINTQWYTTPQGGGLQLTYPYYDGYYYDYGMTSPVLDTTSSRFYNQTVSQNFLYIRKHASTIPALESDWNYIFRVDKDGMIWINGQSLTQMIQSGVDGGAYVPTSGGTITGNLAVTGTLTATASKANQLTHSISVNGKAFDGSADVTVGTIGAAYGGTGQTSLKAAGTAIIGALDTNTTTPVDNDYIATGSSTFYRKTMSKLWDYIKGKITNDHSNLDSLYVQKSGDTMTGSLTVEDSVYADSAQLGDLVVSGSGRFANGLYGNLTGNADTATMASGVADSGNGTKTTFAYSKAGLSTASWIAAWSGYELRAISPANTLATIGGVAKSGDTMTGTLTAPEFNLSGGVNSTTAGFRLTNNGTNMDMGWTWTGVQGAGACFTSSSHPNQPGIFDFFARAKNSSNQEVTKHLIGNISGVLTWDGRRVVTATNSTAVGSTSTPVYIDANGYAQACTSISAMKATQDGNGDTISSTYLKLSGGVLTKADGVTYTATAGDVIYVNVNSIIQSPISGSLWHDLLGFCKATTPKYYTTTNGTTWTEATLEKRLFAHLEVWGGTNIINSTISGSRWEWDGGGFAYSNGYWLVIGVQHSATMAKFDVVLESSNETGESATWTTLMTSTGVSVNSQPVWIRCNGAGGENNLRLTITRNSESDNTTNLPICSIRLLSSRWGNQGKGKEYEYPYTWDGDGNITAKGTFTGTFNGNATSATSATSATTATKLNSTRSFTIGNTAKNVDWSGAVSYSKAEISDEASSTTNGWMSVADKKKLDSITVSDIGTIGANSIRGEKDIKVTISSGIATIGHENSAITAGTISGTATSTLSNGGSFKIPSITYDAYGHITGTAQTTITLPNITSVSSATTATKFNTSRSISLSGDVSGTATADGSNGWSITTTVADDSHNHTVDTMFKPKLSKSYTGIIAAGTAQADSNYYFIKIVPDSYNEQWFIKYKIHANIDNVTEANGGGNETSYVYISGMRNAYATYRTWNNITHTSYRPYYYHVLYRAKEAGISYGHALGIGLRSSYYPTNSTYTRNIDVDIIDYSGCTISFLDTPVLYTNWTGQGSTNYDGITEFDGTTQGNSMSGDRNDPNYEQKEYWASRTAYKFCGRYQLLVTRSDGQVFPVNTTDNNITTTKTYDTSAEFDPFGQIFYHYSGGTTAANGNIGDNRLFNKVRMDLRYAFNVGGNNVDSLITARKPFYLVATPQTNGLAKIHSSGFSQDLPTSDDGLIYIYLGTVFEDANPYRLNLTINHPIYWYKNGAVRQFTGVETGTTFTGAVNFANNTLNLIGDDAYLGDQNVAGCIAIKGKNGATGIRFLPYSGSYNNTILIDGTGAMSIVSSNTSNSTLKISNTGTGSSALMLERQGSNAADWQFINASGNLKIQNNWTSAEGDYFDVLSLAYNTGNTTFKGTVTAPTFVGSLSGNATSATKATQDASGNTITSYYCTLSTNQTISGTKTFSAMPLSSAGICVNSSGLSNAGGVSLWSDKNVDQYGLALRPTTNSGKHGFVQGDYATYSYMYAGSAGAQLTRGWIFKDSVRNQGVASISGAGNAVFNGSVTVGGNATNTSGCRQEFDSALNCLNFIFN